VARCGVDVHLRQHGSGRLHEIWWMGRDQIRMWSSVCKAKTLWVLEATARFSVKSPKGAVKRDGLAGGEVSRCQDNMPHCEVCGVLLVC
jgi:hypothetical protein